MGSLSLVEATEVLAAGQRSLGELADDVNREHDLVVAAVNDALRHAFQAGEALIEAQSRVPAGEWVQWIDENLSIVRTSAGGYMRLAHYRAEIMASGVTSISQAKRYLTGLDRRLLPNAYSDEVRTEAQRLRTEGLSYHKIAALLDVSAGSVQGWCDPAWAKHRDERAARRRKERGTEHQQRKRIERELLIKRAVSKRGAAAQKLYAICERLQDDIAQAHNEATDPEARRHYALMGEHYRKMRDEGVRALGIQ